MDWLKTENGLLLPHRALSRRGFLGVACVGALTLALPGLAFADDEETEGGATTETEASAEDSAEAARLKAQAQIRSQIIEMREELSQDNDNYHQALEIYEQAQADVAAAQQKIDAATVKIESLQQELMGTMRERYRNGDVTMLDVVFGSASFDEFSTKIEMIDRMTASEAALTAETRELRSQVEAERTVLEEAQELARQELETAQAIKEAAEAKIAELVTMYDALDAGAQSLVESEQELAIAQAQYSVEYVGDPEDIEPTPDAAEYALTRLGCPYVWGAAGPDEFDCSGLVVWAYGQAGVSGLPHYTESLYSRALAQGLVLHLSDVQAGDVLYRPGHVGIALDVGGLPYVHAPTAGAYVRNTDTLGWAGFVCGLRFPA